jgi:hypothetical protein
MQNSTASQISDLVNSTLFSPIKVGKALANDHPYLQQETFKMMLAFIEHQADKNHYDGRNEFTVKLCKELHKVAKEFTYESILT